MNKILKGDCLELMKDIPDGSIDMILCDLPYGTTACKWDTIIPFDLLWEKYDRVIKDNGAIVLTASQPFTSALIMSNPKLFKYEWIWEKSSASNFVHSKYQPLKSHENILVFSKFPAAQNSAKRNMNYNPQFTEGKTYNKGLVELSKIDVLSGGGKKPFRNQNTTGRRFPRSVQYFKTAESEGKYHPTQKPTWLFEYLIKTYTNEGDLVLDNCAGSFTTAIASLNTNRNYICMEQDETYFNIGKNRINQWHESQKKLEVSQKELF